MTCRTLLVSERIADCCQSFSPSMLTEGNVATIRRSLLDTLAVGVGGRQEHASKIALEYAKTMGGGGSSRVWGSKTAINIEAAAFCNGVSAHALDYDDVTPIMRGHASVVLWPALLALAEPLEATSEHLFASFAIGFEVLCQLGKALADDMYRQGWHTTCTLGVIGATVACAYLAKLTREQVVSAIGLAVAQAAGIRQSFGTMAKPFQVGSAASASVRAVQLARMGFTGPSESIDGLVGFCAVYGSGQSLADAFTFLSSKSLGLSTYGVDIKKYPACYATHRAIDGILTLRSEGDIRWADVDRINVGVHTNGLQPLISGHPSSGLEAKFSMEYAIATALEDGALELGDYTDERANRAGIASLLDRIEASEDSSGSEGRYAKLEVCLKSGSVVSQYVQSLTGEHAVPLDTAGLMTKVADCLAWGASSVNAQSLTDAVLAMPDCSVKSVLDSLAD